MKHWSPVLALTLLALAGVAETAQVDPQSDLRPRRLFFGAPPQVPHDTGMPASECLSCHAGPGAEASQTPHPGEAHCQQCHVESTRDLVPFRRNRFAPLLPPPLSSNVNVGQTPVMRHSALLHEDCLSCHGPGVEKDIVPTPHPERSGCQLCHLPQRAD